MPVTKSLQKYFSIPKEKEVTKIDKDVTIFLVTMSCRIKFNYKCLSWHKGSSNKIDKELKKRFKNTYKFSCYFLVKKMCLSLWVYGWMGKVYFLKKKKELYGNLNMEDITYAY